MTRRTPDWIAADWGSTHLRVWLMSERDETLDARSSTGGAGHLDRSEFESTLLSLVEDVLAPGRATPVFACGMVGSRQGWVEAPYARVTCLPPGYSVPTTAPSVDPRLQVLILPGVCQDEPPDVMRGEETQVVGFLSQNPGFDGILCLPGTHSKWVELHAGRIARFRTFMTGELFALLCSHSVLRHSVGDAGWDDGAFEAGIREAFADLAALGPALFSIRAASLLKPGNTGMARARLSGLLLGYELNAARSIWAGKPLAVIGSGAVLSVYQKALSLIGHAAQTADAQSVTLEGLKAAYRQWRKGQT